MKRIKLNTLVLVLRFIGALTLICGAYWLTANFFFAPWKGWSFEGAMVVKSVAFIFFSFLLGVIVYFLGGKNKEADKLGPGQYLAGLTTLGTGAVSFYGAVRILEHAILADQKIYWDRVEFLYGMLDICWMAISAMVGLALVWAPFRIWAIYYWERDRKNQGEEA